MKRYDTLPEGLRGVYLRVMRSLGNQLTARGASGIRSAEELGFLAERVGRIPREGDLGIFSIAKSYRGVFERIAEDDFRSYVVSKRLLQTRVVGFDGVVASVDVLDLSGFDESEEVDDSVAGCDVDDGFEDVETVEDEEDEDEDGLDFEDVDEDEEEEDNSLDFEDVEEEEDNSLDFEDVEEEDDEDEDGLDFEDVEEDEDEDGLDFEDVEEDEDEDSLDFEDVEEDEDNSLDFEDVEEDEDGLDFEDVEEDEDEDNSLDFEDVEEDEDENSLDFEDVDEDEDSSLDFEDDDAEDASNSQSSRTVGTSSRGDTRRRPAAQQAPTPGIRKDWSRIRGVEGNESMETVLSGVESLFSKLRGRRS